MKKALKITGLLILLPILYVVGMIVYALLTDYKPQAQEVPPTGGEAQIAEIASDTISFFNWNIGYCGLGKESDFFNDGGEMVHAPVETVQKNLEGVLSTLAQYKAETDFFLIQEVDRNSARSYETDEAAKITETLGDYAFAFGTNYKVAFVPVPFTEPYGGVLSGVSTWSKYKATESVRYNFEGNYDFPNYLFYLDRCYLLQRYELDSSEHQLVVINTHNSAYDDGTLKKQQMAQLKTAILAEYEAGNYVIVGGDWNQYPAGYQGVEGFPAKQSERKLFVPKVFPAEGWSWAWDASTPTNRELKTVYNTDTTMRSIIDFYLTSPNIEVLSVKGVDLDFEYSDHQPVRLKMRLIK